MDELSNAWLLGIISTRGEEEGEREGGKERGRERVKRERCCFINVHDNHAPLTRGAM